MNNLVDLIVRFVLACVCIILHWMHPPRIDLACFDYKRNELRISKCVHTYNIGNLEWNKNPIGNMSNGFIVCLFDCCYCCCCWFRCCYCRCYFVECIPEKKIEIHIMKIIWSVIVLTFLNLVELTLWKYSIIRWCHISKETKNEWK